MKIESIRDSFLSDYEVYKFFHEQQEENSGHGKYNKKSNKKNPFNYNQVSKDLLEYISVDKNAAANNADVDTDVNMTESQVPPTPTNTNLNKICLLDDKLFSDKLLKLNQYQLFKFEKLQLLNSMPNNLVHMFSIVEECDNRFSETEINEILSILA